MRTFYYKRTIVYKQPGAPMRRIIYSVAMSLDGYIAGPNGEYDWIVMDPDIDFSAIGAQFDTLLMGRKTYQPMAGSGGGGGPFADMKIIVASRTLKAAEHPKVTVVGDLSPAFLRNLKAQAGKNIWLFGGGELFRDLLAQDQVDEVHVAVMPVAIGGGIPFLPTPAKRTKLTLTKHHVYPKTGILAIEYSVARAAA